MGIVAILTSFNAGGGEWTMHPSSKRYRDLRGSDRNFVVCCAFLITVMIVVFILNR